MKRCPFCAEEIQDSAVVCRHCGRELGPLPPRWLGPALPRVLRVLELTIGVGAVLLVGYMLGVRLQWFPPLVGRPDAAPRGSALRDRPPHVVPLLDSRVLELPPGEHFDTLFTVADPRPCVLRGRVVGEAGGSRDVEVLVLDQRGYDDWHNGIGPDALFASGRTSVVTLQVPLPRPGEYALVVSNRFSLFTGKRVRAEEVAVRCQ